ncbi:hypothetical protein [Nocardioides nitrophenolicus]|uniref:hypothetical protein n=1 Tax=Nocardioides nitrophenolicus TaxID=60489 RepID=UPI00195B6D72|nr:hypothetical protein [Nocardioides nitrophenolicus]MBM7517289.1 hypothetical protein [Nocardioides nitrophenolicus]
MEGRALDRPPRRERWAFMVPLTVSLAANDLTALDAVGRVLIVVLGVAAGAAWQLLYRRDLVARLTLPVGAALVAVLVQAVQGEPITLGEPGTDTTARLTYALAVLGGLLATEQVLRRREERRAEGPGRGTMPPWAASTTTSPDSTPTTER